MESFVNQYVLNRLQGNGKASEFVTERVESIPPGWRARAPIRVLDADTFREIFELAVLGENFEPYVESPWSRTW